jgi:predicted GH43/DUF377 family glycosyl hydrolase
MKLVKSPSNPVLPAVDATWRHMLTADPVLAPQADEYWMYIRGQKPNEAGEARCYIGLFATPTATFDGVTWHEYNGNPVQGPGELGTIDDVGPFAGEIIRVDDLYLHYYTAVQRVADPDGRDVGRVKCVALATSEDGLSFRRYGDEPLLRAYTGASVVVSYNDYFYLFFNKRIADGSGELCVIRSRDAYHFDIDETQVALSRGESGAWDSHRVQNPRVFHDQELWYMVYGGSDRFDDNPHHFGVAASEDLIHWYRYPGNPVMSRGEAGEWDDCAIWPGGVAHVGDTYYLYYEGRSSGEPQAVADMRPTGRGIGGFSQVGLATMKTDYFFIRSEMIPQR